MCLGGLAPALPVLRIVWTVPEDSDGPSPSNL